MKIINLIYRANMMRPAVLLLVCMLAPMGLNAAEPEEKSEQSAEQAATASQDQSQQTTNQQADEQESAQVTETAKEDLKKPILLEDLAYGQILFDYYRGNTIEALTNILVAQKRNLLPNHAQSARLLSGVIYLDLGMMETAQAIFNDLLTEEDLKSGLLARIEFYLGKLHYRQGDFPQAEFRLSRVLPSLEIELKDEALIMLSNIAIMVDDKTAARDWLAQVSVDSEMAAVSRFNLGMVWLREQNVDEAVKQLTNIYPGYTEDQVIKSLRDKANVALGYYHLSNQDFALARYYLSNVRLDSPLANKALLGMGWSYGQEDNYKKALAHWNELVTRDIRDLAVQEAMLAVPFAYQRLESKQISLVKYAEASDKFQAQINLIDNLMREIEEGQLIEAFVSNVVATNVDSVKETGIEDSMLFGDQYDYYLFELVSQHQFNEGFRSYQKLGQLAQILSYWESQLPTFSDIMRANQIRFDEKIPVIDQYLAEGAFQEYEASLAEFEANIENLKQGRNFELLATTEQMDTIDRIQGLMQTLERIPTDVLDPEQKQMAERARGLMQWQLENGKSGKIWALEKEAIQIRRVLSEMQTRKVSLANAREKAAVRFAGYQEQVDGATGQLLGLRDKIKIQIDVQASDLKRQIIAVLLKRRATLNHYLLQSDLSIARLHEQAIKIQEIDE